MLTILIYFDSANAKHVYEIIASAFCLMCPPRKSVWAIQHSMHFWMQWLDCLFLILLCTHQSQRHGFLNHKLSYAPPLHSALHMSMAPHVDQVVSDLQTLFYEGIAVGNSKVRFAVSELRGDWKWQKEPSCVFFANFLFCFVYVVP